MAAGPDIPTVDEAGLPGYHIWLWSGLWVPKGTPKDVVAKLNGAMREALADAGVLKRFSRPRPRRRAGRSADAGGVACAPEGGGRQVVADDQGRRRQAGGLIASLANKSNKKFREGQNEETDRRV